MPESTRNNLTFSLSHMQGDLRVTSSLNFFFQTEKKKKLIDFFKVISFSTICVYKLSIYVRHVTLYAICRIITKMDYLLIEKCKKNKKGVILVIIICDKIRRGRHSNSIK